MDGMIHDATEHRGDLGDRAAGLAAMSAELAVLQARAAAQAQPPTSEVCLNCGAPTTGGARWCDAECRDDFVRRQAVRQC